MTQLLLLMGLGFLCCYKCKVREKEIFEFFDKKSTNHMKGICALLVVMHHLSANSVPDSVLGGIWYFSVLSGYLLVGYFFFVSGYGMAYSENTKNIGQVFSKLLKRVFVITVPYVTITLLYAIYFVIEKTDVHLLDYIEAMAKGDPIVRYSWYSIAIIIVYILFAIASLIQNHWYSRVLFFAMIGGYIYVCISLGYSEFWYNAIIAVCLGIGLMDYKRQIYDFLKKRSVLKLVICGVLFLALCIAQIKLGNWLYEVSLYAWWGVKEISLVLFLILLLIIDLHVDFQGKILEKISEISYEIYLTHGFVMMVLTEIGIFKNHYFSYSICVLVVTILASILEHKINRWVIRGKR